MNRLDQLKEAVADRYAVEGVVGEGATSTVYAAQDLRHNRRVAIKVLQPELTATLGAQRFLKEIEIAARLNHPHILPLFDSGETGDLLYYVMPYVDGESLRVRLRREKQLPLDEATRIAREVADALGYAHSEGVVHRDIKPENILLEAGHAVVADFGIARAIAEAGESRLTRTGVTVGTPAYMSPEQAAGDPDIDGRSDLYSLACVLYEMLAGQPPFGGPTGESVVNQHLTATPPPVTVMRPAVPAEVAGAIARALSKTPADRFSPAAQFAEALKLTTPAPAPPGPGRPLRIAAAIAALGLVTVGVYTVTRLTTAPEPIPAPVPRQLTFRGDILEATLARNGGFLGLVARTDEGRERLLVQEIGGTPLELFADDFLCCAQWSPDGSQLLFRAGPRTAGRNLIVPRLGGATPRTVESEIITAWSGDGKSIMSWWPQADTLWITDVASGRIRDSIVLDVPHVWVYAADWAPSRPEIALITSEASDYTLWTARIGDTNLRSLVADTVPMLSPRWAPDASGIYFLRGRENQDLDLWKIELSSDGALRGEPQRILSGVSLRTRHRAIPTLSISEDGDRLVYNREAGFSNVWLWEIGEGPEPVAERALTSGTAQRENPRLSPDGRHVAYVESTSAGAHVAVAPVDGGPARQLTFLETDVWSPTWSPDGGRLAFGAPDQGMPHVWLVDAGGGTPRPLRDTRFDVGNRLAWAPSEQILYQLPEDRNYHFIDPETGEERPLLPESGEGWLYNPRVSPDGAWVAAWWNRTDDEPDGLWLIATDDGSVRLLEADHQPLEWSADGRFIYAIFDSSGGEPQTDIVRIPLDGSGPRLHARLSLPVHARAVALTPDGRRIVAAVEQSQADAWAIDDFDAARRR